MFFFSTINIQKLFDTTKAIPMFFNGIAYFFEQIYSQLNTTEADYSPYGLFSQPHYLRNNCLAIYHIITGGTALPIALYWRASDTESSINESGNDCILAHSRGVKRR